MEQPNEEQIKSSLENADYTARFERLPVTLKQVYANNAIVNAWINFYLMGKCGYIECLEGLIGAMDVQQNEMVERFAREPAPKPKGW